MKSCLADLLLINWLGWLIVFVWNPLFLVEKKLGNLICRENWLSYKNRANCLNINQTINQTIINYAKLLLLKCSKGKLIFIGQQLFKTNKISKLSLEKQYNFENLLKKTCFFNRHIHFLSFFSFFINNKNLSIFISFSKVFPTNFAIKLI